MLDRLERTDDTPELLALLGVPGGELGGAQRETELQRAGEHGADQTGTLGGGRVGDQLSIGHVTGDDAERSERVDRSLDRRGADRSRVESAHAVGREHEQRVEVGGVLEQRDGRSRLEATDDRLAGGGAVDPRCGEEGGDERSGHERAPELLEHERGFRHAELEAAVGLGQT